MALVLLGRSKCPLCSEVMKEGEELKAFPAFLPYDHRFGRFSDAAFHKVCFEKDEDAQAVDDMLYVWERIMKSMPRDLATEEQRTAWYTENFQDWPPKNGVVVYTSLDEDGEWFWSDKDSWEEFEKAEAAANKEMEERREEAYRRDREAWRYSRDDDY
jgi:hypothetical protein